MNVHEACMKFSVLAIKTLPSTSSHISRVQAFRKLSGGDNLLAAEKCLHFMVGMAMAQGALVS